MSVALQIVAILLICYAVIKLVPLLERAYEWLRRELEWQGVRRRLERESLAKYEPTRRIRR